MESSVLLFIESKILRVGRDLKNHLVPTFPCRVQGDFPLGLGAKGLAQLGLGHF